MKPTFLRTFLILTSVGGGFTGATAIGQQMLGGTISSLSEIVLACFFLCLYLYGIYAGFQVIDHSKTWKTHIFIYSLLQTPIIALKSIYYTFLSGFGLTIYLYNIDKAPNTSLNLSFGSSYMFFINHAEEFNQGIGVNIFPLIVIFSMLFVRQDRTAS